MNATDTQTIEQFIERYHIDVDASRPAPWYSADEDWPAVAYTLFIYDQSEQPGGVLVEKSRRAQICFKLGIGHVKWRKYAGATTEESQIIEFYKAGRRYKAGHQGGLATVAAKMARAQKVKPTAYDVLWSLRLSLSDFYNRLSFEDFCAEYGYDTDSRKAEKLYSDAIQEGRETYNWLGEARSVELMESEE